MGTVLVDQQIAAYKPFEKKLIILEEENKKLIFNYDDKKQNKEARSHIFKLRKSKTAVETVRKEEKAASLEHSRRVDQQAKPIMLRFEAMIDHHAIPLKEAEDREDKRVEDITANIKTMEIPVNLVTMKAFDILQIMTELEDTVIDDRFEEFQDVARGAKNTTLTLLDGAFKTASVREAEQMELEQLRLDATRRAEADRIAAAEKAEAERIDAAKKQAEEDAERKAAQDKADIERRHVQEQNEAKEREAQLKRDAEQAERRAEEAEADAKRKVEADKEAERVAANDREMDLAHRKQVLATATTALLEGGLSKAGAMNAIKLISNGKVPNVTISY